MKNLTTGGEVACKSFLNFKGKRNYYGLRVVKDGMNFISGIYEVIFFYTIQKGRTYKNGRNYPC